MRQITIRHIFHVSVGVAILAQLLRGVSIAADFSGLLYGMAATGIWQEVGHTANLFSCGR